MFVVLVVVFVKVLVMVPIVVPEMNLERKVPGVKLTIHCVLAVAMYVVVVVPVFCC